MKVYLDKELDRIRDRVRVMYGIRVFRVHGRIRFIAVTASVRVRV